MKQINLMDLPHDILKVIFKKSRDLSKEEYELNKRNHNEKFKSVIKEYIENKEDIENSAIIKRTRMKSGKYIIQTTHNYCEINWNYICYNNTYIKSNYKISNDYEPRIKYLKENHIEVFNKNRMIETRNTNWRNLYYQVMNELYVANNRDLLLNICASTDEDSSSSEEE